jgi:hypothetical protein
VNKNNVVARLGDHLVLRERPRYDRPRPAMERVTRRQLARQFLREQPGRLRATQVFEVAAKGDGTKVAPAVRAV